MKPIDGARLAQAYRTFFASADGQIVLGDLVRRFGFTTQSTFDPNNVEATILREGQRTVMIYIGRWQSDDLLPDEDEIGTF